jgi:preprotein translocase subunit YajC
MEQAILMVNSTSTNPMLGGILPLIVIMVVFYLLVFMPMRKKQKKLEAVISALKSGDKVITNSGIYGVIAGVKDRTFILKISDQVKIEISKNAVAGLQPEENS